jgi:hypothetical protein
MHAYHPRSSVLEGGFSCSIVGTQISITNYPWAATFAFPIISEQLAVWSKAQICVQYHGSRQMAWPFVLRDMATLLYLHQSNEQTISGTYYLAEGRHSTRYRSQLKLHRAWCASCLGNSKGWPISELSINIVPMGHKHAFSTAENKLLATPSRYLPVQRLSECEGY